MKTLSNIIGEPTSISDCSNLSGSLCMPEPVREQALLRVRQVCSQLVRQRHELTAHAASFSQGAAPAALLLASAGRAFGIDTYVSIAIELMDHAVTNMNYESQTFYGGMSGVLWCALNLDRVCGSNEYSGLAEDVDEALLDALAPEKEWRGHFDIINGVAGIGIYVIERHEASSFPALVEAVVEHLERLSSRDCDGLFWPTTRKMNVGPWKGGEHDRISDIGMAHGSAGVVALFSSLIEVGAPRERIHSLLVDAAEWLLAQRQGSSETGVYPYTVGSQLPTRGAWCYGDFSSANALLLASRALKRPDLGADASFLLNGAVRRTDSSLQIEDAWICHGYVGLAHLLRRAGEHLGDFDLIRQAFRFYTGALASPSQAPTLLRCEPFYLEGDIGNSLCYLDACGLITYRWDRPCLFV